MTGSERAFKYLDAVTAALMEAGHANLAARLYFNEDDDDLDEMVPLGHWPALFGAATEAEGAALQKAIETCKEAIR